MGFCVGLFDNKLLICGCILLWTCLSSAVFCIIMIRDGSNFLMVGPNDRNQLFGVKKDSWFKWWVRDMLRPSAISPLRPRAQARHVASDGNVVEC
jgi:hypothetical protein